LPNQSLTEDECRDIMKQLLITITDKILRPLLIENASYLVTLQAAEKSGVIPKGSLAALREEAVRSEDIQSYAERKLEPFLQIFRSLEPGNWDQLSSAISKLFDSPSPLN